MEGNQGRQIIWRISPLLILSHASSGFDWSGFTGKNRLTTSYTWKCYLHYQHFVHSSSEGSTWWQQLEMVTGPRYFRSLGDSESDSGRLTVTVTEIIAAARRAGRCQIQVQLCPIMAGYMIWFDMLIVWCVFSSLSWRIQLDVQSSDPSHWPGHHAADSSHWHGPSHARDIMIQLEYLKLNLLFFYSFSYYDTSDSNYQTRTQLDSNYYK